MPGCERAGDKGRMLRSALGLSEPNYGPSYRNPAYFGGYRNAEDERDFAEQDRLADLREAEREGLPSLSMDGVRGRAA